MARASPPRYILSSHGRRRRKRRRRRFEVEGKERSLKKEKGKKRSEELVTSERLSRGSEKERERAADRGLLFRLLESRLVSEAGGPIGGVLPWTPRSVADQSCSIVARTCYIACRRAPPPGIARRPCVSLRGNLLRNLPHDSSLPPSLSLSLKRLRVRLSVCPSTLYICVCGSRPFVLLAKPPTSSRPLHSSPSPSRSLSLSSFFPLQNFSGFYGARSSDSRTLVRTYRRTPVRDTDRRGLTSTHPPPPTPLSGVFDLNPGQWGRGNGPVYYRPVWKTLTPAADYGHTEG